MPTAPTTSKSNEKLAGLLWGAFAILAAVALFDDHGVVPIICWSLALGVAFVLVSLGRRANSASNTDRHADPNVPADQA